VPADVAIPLHPPGVARCPNVPLPRLGNVLPWTGAPSPALQAWALAQLRYPLGTIIRDTVAGAPVVARIECHYAYGAHPEAPGTWHKGASVYRPASYDATTGALVPISTAPAGWPSSAA
jgi:hypothetical protein